MKSSFRNLSTILGCLLVLLAACRNKAVRSAFVPMTLDHNRMLVDAEIQRQDGSWRQVRLWVDTGNPDFFLSESLALDLGIDLPTPKNAAPEQPGSIEVSPPSGVRIAGMPLDFRGVKTLVLSRPSWLFKTMHIEANLPSMVMKKYQVVFDYPRMRFGIADPGSWKPKGERVPAAVHPVTGVVQIDAIIDGDSLSFALDNGASYSFTSTGIVDTLSRRHPGWPRGIGAVGCANIWGWWPQEEAWSVLRIPEILCGPVSFADAGIVGLPNFFGPGGDVGKWYSQKTARPVKGFLGPNAFKAYKLFFDFAGGAVWFEKGPRSDSHDMDIVGLTLRLEFDGRYRVVGIAQKQGKPSVEGVASGDILLKVDGKETTHATMGTVVDRLRGNPGDVRALDLERDGKPFTVQAKVERFL